MPSIKGVVERLDLTILDNVGYMLIDAVWSPKLWRYAVVIYNVLPHSALHNHKRPN